MPIYDKKPFKILFDVFGERSNILPAKDLESRLAQEQVVDERYNAVGPLVLK